MGVYRVEESPNKRAGCVNAECKSAGIKIQKGEFRYAIQIMIQDKQSWTYKHWGCVTPNQIEHLITACEGDTELVDGYDELPKEFQEKIDFALENGHIPDEDWKGDPEKNRPGQKGFRLTKKDLAQKAKEEAARDEGSDAKPKKKGGRKAKVKAEPENDDSEPAAPAPKKKGERKVKAEPEDDGSEQEAPAPKKKGGRLIKAEDVEEEAPAPKKRGKATKKADDGEAVPAPKKRGRPVKAESSDEAASAPKKTRPTRGKKVEYKEEDDDDDEAPPAKKARGKKAAAEESHAEMDDGGETEEEVEAPKPKGKRGKKKSA